MHKLIATALVAISTITGTLTQELSLPERREIANEIVQWRSIFIGDGVRWNWCRAAPFWDSTGTFVGSEEVAVRSTDLLSRRNCPADPRTLLTEHSAMVEVLSLRLRGDSAFVTTVVRKRDIEYSDEYILLRNAFGSFAMRAYRIRFASNRH